MSSEILHLAAFTSESGGGNPAGLVLDASALSEAEMQRIAHDVGHPETAFVVESAVGGDARHVRVRYFSPAAEVPFCGHATIATSVVLAGLHGEGEFVLETAVGPIRVATGHDGDHRLSAAFTSVEPVVRDLDPAVADALLGLLGLERDDLDDEWPIREAYAGNWHPVVALRQHETFDAFTFDAAAVSTLMTKQGWTGTVAVVHRHAVAPGDELVVEARNLFPAVAAGEDPATGSAAAALGGYLRDLGAVPVPSRFVIHQGGHVGRPSVLVVDVPVSGGITVAGTAGPLA